MFPWVKRICSHLNFQPPHLLVLNLSSNSFSCFLGSRHSFRNRWARSTYHFTNCPDCHKSNTLDRFGYKQALYSNPLWMGLMGDSWTFPFETLSTRVSPFSTELRFVWMHLCRRIGRLRTSTVRALSLAGKAGFRLCLRCGNPCRLRTFVFSMYPPFWFSTGAFRYCLDHWGRK